MIAASTQLQGTNIFTVATNDPAVGETVTIGDYTIEFVAAEDDDPAVEGNLTAYSASYSSNIQIAGALADAINNKTPFSAQRTGNIVYVINDQIRQDLACSTDVTGATNKWTRDTLSGAVAPADTPVQLCMVQKSVLTADVTAGSISFGLPVSAKAFEVRVTNGVHKPKDFGGSISKAINDRMITLTNNSTDDFAASDRIAIFYTTEVKI